MSERHMEPFNVDPDIRLCFCSRGRYSARHEQGVHHFHRLLAEFLRP